MPLPIEKSLYHHISEGNYYVEEEFDFKITKFELENLKEQLFVDDRNFQMFDVITKGYFVNFNNKSQILPCEGWKIHISIDVLNINKLLNTVGTVIAKDNISFKVVWGSKNLDRFLDSNFDRVQFGKFITIYPSNSEQFIEIIEKLYEDLKEFKGPDILTDFKYKDSNILFYRYGGILPKQFVDSKGQRRYFLNYNGKKTEDVRSTLPYLPEGIKNPFVMESVEKYLPKELDIYEFEGALKFFNNGGVYKAKNKNTNENVVIKEVSRFMNYNILNGQSAIDYKENEYDVLTKLENVNGLPKAINFIKSDDRIFLIEEYVSGKSLDELFFENPFYSPRKNKDNDKKFLSNFYRIMINLYKLIEKIHDNEYLISDFNPTNILFDESFKVFFIDVESFEKDSNRMKFKKYTPNFSRSLGKMSSKSEDIFSSFLLMTNILINRNGLIHFKGYVEYFESIERYVEKVYRGSIVKLISFMLKAIKKEHITIEEVICFLEQELNQIVVEYKMEEQPIDIPFLENEICNEILSQIQTNQIIGLPISEDIAESFMLGKSGITYAYNEYNSNNSNEEEQKKLYELMGNKIFEKYSPSFGYGSFGIIFPYIKLIVNDTTLLKEILNKVYSVINNVNNNETEPGLTTGISGVGIFCLYMYDYTKSEEWMRCAEKIADHSQKLLVNEYGIGYGNSGIAVYLMNLYVTTKNKKYLSKAKNNIEMEISNVVYDGTMVLGLNFSKEIETPYVYIEHGIAGLIKAMVSYFRLTGEEYYLELSEKFVESFQSNFVVKTGYCYGVSGLIDVLHDLYLETGNTKYLEQTNRFIQLLLFSGKKTKTGRTFPSTQDYRASLDWCYGSMGILLTMKKLSTSFEVNPFFKRIDTSIKEREI